MSYRIRALGEPDLEAYVGIMAGAYPGLKIVSEADRQRMGDRLAATFEDPAAEMYGLSDNGQLLAGMILYDFEMNYRGAMVRVGGLGSLAVDLLHRKKKVAKKMVTFYLNHFREQDVSLALLYPFRPDFYRKMGFGYGTKMSQYSFRPAGLRPWRVGERQLSYLGENDVERVLACYDSYAAAKHGMILGSRWRMKQMLTSPSIRTVGCEEQGKVLGYVAFDFENQGDFLKNDLRVRQLIYQDAHVLNELLAFLRSLADQCERIVFTTQEKAFHYLLDDPRSRTNRLIPSVYHESNTQGVGLMYRVIDARTLFESRSDIQYGNTEVVLKITLEDTFMPENNQGIVLSLKNGSATLVDARTWDAEIQMDVSDFSSMMMGAIGLEQLVAYGLARVTSDRDVKQIGDVFATSAEPICMTAF